MKGQKITYPSLETPAVLVNMDRLEANIKEMSELVANAGVKLRPHIKVHQSADIAKMQLEAGACGVEVGNIAQAECMAAEGIDDILIAHPFYGEHKLEALKRVVSKPGLKISVLVEMVEQAEGLSQVGQAVGRKIPVLIKVDTGVHRYGTFPGEPTLNFAKKLSQIPNIELEGIYAHESRAVPTDEGVARVALEVGSIMGEMARLLRREGFTIKEVAVGASTTFRATCRYLREGMLTEITEIHPGACVIGDLMYMAMHANTREACALTVLTSVVSTSHSGHIVVDAGYKTFGVDPLIGRRNAPDFFWEHPLFGPLPSYGPVQERPDLWLGRLGAESGWVFYKNPEEEKLKLCERIEIVPNNATLVLNIHDQAYGVRNGKIERVFTINGRGKGS